MSQSDIISSDLNVPAVNPELWLLNPKITFLNHGSFGSCPRAVLERQNRWRRRMERQPVKFFVLELEEFLDKTRARLAEFIGAEAPDLVFVPNATTGVNAVLRSLRFQPGDELVVSDHEYNACRNALNFVAEQTEAKVVEAKVPFPFETPDEIVEAILSKVTSRTRLVLLDHVSSQTGVVMPIKKLVDELSKRGIETLVDGAHAPGMLPLNLTDVGATYYTGNCHKWLCAPKGAGFLCVQRARQKDIRPLAISHGANSPRADRSRFLIEFDWTGTWDPSAYLCVPIVMEYMDALLPGGWPTVMQRNRALALAGRKLLCEALDIPLPCPDECIGALASMPLPDSPESAPPTSPLYADPLQDQLRKQHFIEVPVIPWPAPPKRLIRISAQLYNSLPQYALLAEALKKLLK